MKFSSYFPYNAKLRINANEWAKRQAGPPPVWRTRYGFRISSKCITHIFKNVTPKQPSV